MKIALIAPSNLLYMPYVRYYEEILESNDIMFDIINWERFDGCGCMRLSFRDGKNRHKRNFIDYNKFKNHVIEILREEKYEKVIIFGLQMTFFLKDLINGEYRKKCVIDIRDYNRISRFFNMSEVFSSTNFVVISSPAYKEWLPIREDYVINHNISTESIPRSPHTKHASDHGRIQISNIGAIRDYKANINLIKALKNIAGIEIIFHGQGEVNESILKYINSNSITNVHLRGRYCEAEEENLYQNADFINVLRFADGVNNNTALPNRLYKAAIYGRPLLALEGTYLSKIIHMYKLGLVVDSFYKIEDALYQYLREFNPDEYARNRMAFLKWARSDNEKFEVELLKFVLS